MLTNSAIKICVLDTDITVFCHYLVIKNLAYIIIKYNEPYGTIEQHFDRNTLENKCGKIH